MTDAPMTDRCRLCGADSKFVFEQTLLAHHRVRYFDCAQCGYLQTEQPHWLAEAYASAINDVDTGILRRNLLNVQRVVMTLATVGQLRGKVIDHAGGYGILVRLLRDVGVDAYWQDKYCQNLHARGFEGSDDHYALLTAFEVFEHMEAPLNELRLMLSMAPVVLLTTELVETATPPSPDWWYLGQEHGQHIGFFRARSLAWMAEQLGCHHASDGQRLHLFSLHPAPRHWGLLQAFKRFAPRLAAWQLESRTTSDFDALRRRQA